jgi:hypothetical protein
MEQEKKRRKQPTEQEEQKNYTRAEFSFQNNPAQTQFPVILMGHQAPPAVLLIFSKYEIGSLGVLGDNAVDSIKSGPDFARRIQNRENFRINLI